MTNQFFDLNAAQWLSAFMMSLLAVFFPALRFVRPRSGSEHRRSLVEWLLDKAFRRPWEQPENENEKYYPLPGRLTPRQWEEMIERPHGGRWIGTCERALFFGLLVGGIPQGIPVWLGFKIAAKWETWKNIVQWPETLPGDRGSRDGVEWAASYAGAKNQIGGWLGGRFTLGTLLNFLIALVAYVAFLGLAWWIDHACPN